MQPSGTRRARLTPETARVDLRGTAISAAARPETRLRRLAARAPRLPVEAAQHSAIGYVQWLAIEVRPIRTRPPQHEIGRVADVAEHHTLGVALWRAIGERMQDVRLRVRLSAEEVRRAGPTVRSTPQQLPSENVTADAVGVRWHERSDGLLGMDGERERQNDDDERSTTGHAHHLRRR